MGDKLLLQSEFFKSRMEKISKATDVAPEYVVSATSKAVHTAVSIAFNPAGEVFSHHERETRIPTECGTLIRSELEVFREICSELLLEYEKGKFSVNCEQFRILVKQAADWLVGFDPEEVLMTIFQIYAGAMLRYMKGDPQQDENGEGAIAHEGDVSESTDTDTDGHDGPPHLNGRSHDIHGSGHAARERFRTAGRSHA